MAIYEERVGNRYFFFFLGYVDRSTTRWRKQQTLNHLFGIARICGRHLETCARNAPFTLARVGGHAAASLGHGRGRSQVVG